ncbi:hypothetical protein SMICM17S_00621 [Streptomyces microflavus]
MREGTVHGSRRRAGQPQFGEHRVVAAVHRHDPLERGAVGDAAIPPLGVEPQGVEFGGPEIPEQRGQIERLRSRRLRAGHPALAMEDGLVSGGLRGGHREPGDVAVRAKIHPQ